MKPYVGTVSITVKDLDRAKAFFMDNFGWVCTADVTNGDYRWVSVAPSESGQTNIHLSKGAGAGESTMIALAPAIGNAIFQATGTRLRSLPMAPRGLKTA